MHPNMRTTPLAHRQGTRKSGRAVIRIAQRLVMNEKTDQSEHAQHLDIKQKGKGKDAALCVIGGRVHREKNI